VRKTAEKTQGVGRRQEASYPPIVRWAGRDWPPVLRRLMRRGISTAAERTAQRIIEGVARRGDRALVEYEARFDGCHLTERRLRVCREELANAAQDLPSAFRKAAREAHRRIAAFARRELLRDWRVATPSGGVMGERFVPLDRVGVYVPGGTAPLASTALMTVTLARVAGVPEVVACSPPTHDGDIHPAVRFCLELAGATEVYRLGGVQAVAAMALGTRTIRPVQKIVGPGGVLVTAAKRLLYGRVALDMVAGPSEIAVLADDSADPREVAADLLSQAEHGSGEEKVLLATVSTALARAVREELHCQLRELPRREYARRVLKKGAALVVVPDLERGVELCNRFAPEHLELLVRRPERLLRRVRAAGAVFLGRWTPEPVGDFAAGPSHVLPTGGTAVMFSGLTARDFQRRISYVRYARGDLEAAAAIVREFARMEQLDAHGRTVTVRLSDGSETA